MVRVVILREWENYLRVVSNHIRVVKQGSQLNSLYLLTEKLHFCWVWAPIRIASSTSTAVYRRSTSPSASTTISSSPSCSLVIRPLSISGEWTLCLSFSFDLAFTHSHTRNVLQLEAKKTDGRRCTCAPAGTSTTRCSCCCSTGPTRAY